MEQAQRRSPVVIPSLAVSLVILVLLAGSLVLGRGAGCAFAGDRCLRVLFIGNSYTSVNDLPGTFAALVRSGGGAVETAMIAPGGAFLADNAASPEVVATIAGTPWTAVVLQEQSQVPAVAAARDTQMAPAAASLVAAIRADGAQPYLLDTWGHRDGWPQQGMDRAAMQAAINASYRDVAARSAVIVVPAGEAWTRAAREAPGIALWQEDGSHPTAAGTYLAACVLCHAHGPQPGRAGGDRRASGSEGRCPAADRGRSAGVGWASLPGLPAGRSSQAA
jgi:hypothetical protein